MDDDECMCPECWEDSHPFRSEANRLGWWLHQTATEHAAEMGYPARAGEPARLSAEQRALRQQIFSETGGGDEYHRRCVEAGIPTTKTPPPAA